MGQLSSALDFPERIQALATIAAGIQAARDATVALSPTLVAVAAYDQLLALEAENQKRIDAAVAEAQKRKATSGSQLF